VPAERVVENLNLALHEALERDPDVYLLGEDIADPYGGAFRATRGLSGRYPGRVLATPISEGAIAGAGAGLALAGGKAIVEMMFADFVTLAFDQIVNFASKSVAMYGRELPMHLVVRCPSGGGRGYGPTHSQSPQKHFVGVPHLELFEMSALHDNRALVAGMLAGGRPCVLFEDKVLYTRRMYRDGMVDDVFRFDLLPGEPPVARVFAGDPDEIDYAIVVGGGLAEAAVSAARALLLRDEFACQVFVPARLWPLPLEEMLAALARARRICVVEAGTAGGGWGAEMAQALHSRLWGRLAGPVRLVHAADSIIPTAPHLERTVLVQDTDIYKALRAEESRP
jgi:pyruvate/2-oxoglutarate/acetoin dehydrogenase E1 component